MVFSRIIQWLPSRGVWEELEFYGFFHGRAAYMNPDTGRYYCPFTEEIDLSENYLPAEGAIRLEYEEVEGGI